MPLMHWNEKLSVGVPTVDGDHQRLVELINVLYDGIIAGQGKETLGPVLDGLVAYTTEHFAREERYFAETGYPEAEAHAREHAALVEQVLEVQSRYRSGATSTLSLVVMNFLKTWLVKHIQGSDKKFGPHLIGRGVH